MSTDLEKTKKKSSLKKLIAFTTLAAILVAGVLLYSNFNQLLSNALHRSFDSKIFSDVYELKFENLNVNIFDGTIKVNNVTILPRERPLTVYPYVNSSFRLKTEKLILKKVELFTLLKSSQLKLEQISITKPEVELVLAGNRHIFLPFKDTATTALVEEKTKKKFIDSFLLSEFQLVNASFHVMNFKKQREFKIQGLSITLQDLFTSRHDRKDVVTFNKVSLSVNDFNGRLKKGAMKTVSFKDFQVGVDSLKVQITPDTSIFRFRDFETGLHALDLQTEDSLFHLTLQSFRLSYKEKSIKLDEVSFKPNMSDEELQKRFAYQKTHASGTVGAIHLLNVDFDSLLYYKSLSVRRVILHKPTISIYKDNTKPVDKNRLPVYLGQQVRSIPVPLWIGQLQANHVQLTNTERKRDSSYAKVTIHRGTAIVKNITNHPTKNSLVLSASAYLENKVHFNLTLGFDYAKPQFTMNGTLGKFNLVDLNPVIQAYTPAKISTGVSDNIAFSGVVYKTFSQGTMKFLFHDLSVDLDLPKKARWKSSIIAFAANTVLTSSNPGSADLPPRVVQFRAERDMNKGFINLILKSVLSGLKETMIMSKENKKAYREAKKEMKKQSK